MTEPLLSLAGVSKRFVTARDLLGRPTAWNSAADDVTLDLVPSETLALVGETGAGKSTVGRLALHLIKPDAGTIRLLGEDPSRLSSRALRRLRAGAQMVFQDPFSSLNPSLRVGAAIDEALALHSDLSRAERRTRTVELLARVGIDADAAGRRPFEFSGGQLQRIAIARALASQPRLIVCDEPVAALDASVRAQVLNVLRELQEQSGIAYLFISHDLPIVRHIADRIAVMYQGRVVEVARADELFTNPRHPYTRELLKSIPVADPRRRMLGQHLTDVSDRVDEEDGLSHPQRRGEEEWSIVSREARQGGT